MELIKADLKLRKTERLTKSKPIQLLFENGTETFVFPIKVVWQKIDDCEFPAKVMFVVPKKRFKTAVLRNQIRRQMKETYRLQKNNFYKALTKLDAHVYVSIIYLGPENISTKSLQPAFLKIFKQITKTIGEQKYANL